MTNRLEKYINKNIKSSELKKFLLKIALSKEISHRLLCCCILIELKNNLITKDDLTSTIDYLKTNGLDINFNSFIKNREQKFSKKQKGRKKQYTRIVDKTTFENRIGSFRNRSAKIDRKKIAINGWSTKNGVVWVTPLDELILIWEKCKNKKYPADDILDHLGFPRDEEGFYVRINYSPDFPEETYQPNSSNRLWHYEYNLFLSYKDEDYFGRTYNENGIKFAREQVHQTSYYFDTKFSAEYIKKSSEKFPINDYIIDEGLKRLDL